MKKKIIKYGAGSLVAALLVAGGIVAWQNNQSAAAPNPDDKQAKTKANPMFSLASVDGWWQGATNHTSMAAFQNNVHNCFVSAAYFPASQVPKRQTKRQKADQWAKSSGHKVTKLGTKDMTLKTASGPISYTLTQEHMSSPSNDPSQKLKGGQEFGYINVDGGQIEIEGYCDEPSQLPSTIPALNAIRLNKKN